MKPSLRYRIFKKWGVVVHNFDESATMQLLKEAFDLPPERAIAFLSRKLPNQSWSWKDIQAAAHNHAFTVAKVMDADLLVTIQDALINAMETGQSLSTLKKELMPRLEQAGWIGTKTVVNPDTGKEQTVELGTPSRLQTIFQTNLQSAFMNGRYEQIKITQKTRPYIKIYNPDPKSDVCIGVNGKVIRADDAALRIPPYHYRCKSSIVSATEKEVAREGLEVIKGSELTGIHESFDAAPGTPYKPDVSKYPSDIGKQLKNALS